jgi:acetyltransferase-like isoleucine patch superfamily enzyme
MKKIFKKTANFIKCNLAVRSNEKFSKYLRDKGFTIGENCQFFARKSLYFDMTRPFMISIGNNVIITKGVTILTHGYDWAVIKHEYKKVIGSARRVVIGNNVFIGVNSVILPGATIQDNVIIGSGATISGVVESNSVYAGNPAKKIMTLDEYKIKREKNVLKEIVELAECYIEKYGEFPNEKIFYEHFDLFVPRNKESFGVLSSHVITKSKPYLSKFLNTTPYFKDFNDMKSFILNKIK